MQEGLPARVRAVQEPPLSEPGSNDYALDPVARAEAMSGPPEVPAAPKPPPQPRSVLLGAAKITVRAPIPRVFEALVNAEQLAIWWAEDARIEAELGGRFENLVRVTTESLTDDPESVRDLRRFLADGEWQESGEAASVKHKEVKGRQAFFRKMGSRWFLENRRKPSS